MSVSHRSLGSSCSPAATTGAGLVLAGFFGLTARLARDEGASSTEPSSRSSTSTCDVWIDGSNLGRSFSIRRSRRASGCHATVRMVSVESARNPTSAEIGRPSRPVSALARKPGRTPTSRGTSSHSASGGSNAVAPTLTTAPMKNGTSTESPPTRIAVRFMSSRSSQPKPARATPTPSRGNPTAPSPNTLQRKRPIAAGTVPGSWIGRSARPSERPRTSAATAPIRRVDSGVTRPPPRARGAPGVQRRAAGRARYRAPHNGPRRRRDRSS